MSLKILLFGKSGQLGHHFVAGYKSKNSLIALDRSQADFTRPTRLAEIIYKYKPQIIINTAAYTNVDRAEEESDLAFQVNFESVGIIAQAAQKCRSVLLHFSTDFVFNGLQTEAYKEDAKPDPLNAYGQSKLKGEEAIEQEGGAYLILRTSWVYSKGFDNFMTRVLRWLHEREHLHIVNDQVGSPTWAQMLVDKTVELLRICPEDPYGFFREHAGIYHLAGKGTASRYKWACTIQQEDPDLTTQRTKKIDPASSDEFTAPARRPANSSLDCEKIQTVFNIDLAKWDDYLRNALVA